MLSLKVSSYLYTLHLY